MASSPPPPAHPLPALASSHFLSLPRPDPSSFTPPAGVPDTSTLAAHDFDVDTRTGFMPPQPPLARLPIEWEAWETMLADATEQHLQLGDKAGLSDAEKAKSERWRQRVRDMPVLPTADLVGSERQLRRAHHVLAWIMHFYIHSLPPSEPVVIPRSITLPHLRVSAHLRLPPVLTYSDDVLYNWDYLRPPSPSITPGADSDDDNDAAIPTLYNLRIQSSFTSTPSESEFYLSSARIELAGTRALALMRATMDEAFVSDALAFRRIARYLLSLADIIDELTALLMRVREGCDPDVFWGEIRPWFKGEDSSTAGGKWVWEGLGEAGAEDLDAPTELSGPSAGQSSLVHALDVFLGVDRYSHDAALTGHKADGGAEKRAAPSFLTRMQAYMPRHHRAFLTHLSANPRPLRDLVISAAASSSQSVATSPSSPPSPSLDILAAYNAAVASLRRFRDAHMTIVALYILGPARRAKQAGEVGLGATGNGAGAHPEFHAAAEKDGDAPEKGTGGTDLVMFLKGVRDRTAGAVLPS